MRAAVSSQSAQLLATVAHELRSPLGAIHLAAAALQRGGTEPAVGNFQAVLHRQLGRMSRLIEDLLDVEAGRTGRLRVDLGRVRVHEVVEEALEGSSAFRARRRQQMVLHAMPSSDCVIDADALRLTQILVNLLDNASKYSPEGGEIGLAVVVAGTTLTATVLDNGIGIEPKFLQQVFEPFFREPRAVRFHDDGLGLGLSLVRDLVAAHGGQVGAQSDGVGLGSQFVVRLPLCRAGAG